MRKALNLNPYRDCYKPEELMERKDNIFLLLDNEDILGGVILANKEVDEFFINQKYQGQEYGRKLNFASTIETNEPHVGGLNSCLQAVVFKENIETI